MKKCNEVYYQKIAESFRNDFEERVAVLQEHAAQLIANSMEHDSVFYEGREGFEENGYWYTVAIRELNEHALQKDEQRAMVGLKAFEKMYLYVEENPDSIESFLDKERAAYTKLKRAGYYKDGSYVYHTLHPMNQTYGLAHFTSLCLMENVTAGTAFELKNVQRSNVVSFFSK